MNAGREGVRRIPIREANGPENGRKGSEKKKLTTRRRQAYFALGIERQGFGKGRERDDAERGAGPVSRRTGDDDSADAEKAAAARVRAGADHQAHIERFAADRGRIAVSGAAEAAESGTGEGGMGRLGDEPAGADLPADEGGSEAPGAGSVAIREDAGRDYDGAGGGEEDRGG